MKIENRETSRARLRLLSPSQVLEQIKNKSQYAEQNYLAMYSSWLDGIVCDPSLMFVPIDDHMVHRGDAVFEVFRGIPSKDSNLNHSGEIIELKAHLDRLEKSAQAISLCLPFNREKIESICFELLSLTSSPIEVLFRLYVSRGPGGFTTNPLESVGSQLYIVMTRFHPYPESHYQHGVKAGSSQVVAKPIPYCRIKSCNYLPNVLMKMEAIERRWDYAIGFTEKGELAEGSTENILLVTKKGEVLAPPFDYTLEGTTLQRVMQLLEQKKRQCSFIERVGFAHLFKNDIVQASEIMMVGTTMGVLPVTTWENRKVGDNGQPGPVYHFIKKILEDYYLKNRLTTDK